MDEAAEKKNNDATLCVVETTNNLQMNLICVADKQTSLHLTLKSNVKHYISFFIGQSVCELLLSSN